VSGSAPTQEPAPEIAQLKAERDRLRRALASGAGGRKITQALSDAIDRAITGVWDRLKPSVPAALVAIGGYGRREQCPGSDVDLMVLHDGSDEVGRAAKALFYELWDAGLQVGHSIRTIKEAVKAAREDFPAETSFLTPRLVAGDEDLFQRFVDAALRQSRRSPEAFFERVREVTGERRARSGDASAELEPNLKEGRGGLRDLETIGWLATVCGPQELPVDAQTLERAADHLLRVRSALHFLTNRHADVLLMQLHSQVAEFLEMPSDGGVGPSNEPEEQYEAPEDVLIRSLYEECRAIAFALDHILDPRYRAAVDTLPPELLEGRWTPDAVKDFIAILAAGDEGWPAFRILEQSGALMRALPEWEAIRCLPQRNVYHRHAVDVHCVETSIAMAGFFEAERAAEPAVNGKATKRRRLFKSEAPEEAQSAAGGSRPGIDWEALCRKVAADSERVKDRLLLAALLHDIGKGTTEDHSVRGVALARSALGRMGIPLIEKEEVAWLVRSHLLLTKTAVRRDFEDESLVVELAETVGSTERLRTLYLLSAADGLATGPSAWTGWTATLVSDLFTRIYHVLDRGELVNADASRVAHTREAELRAALGGFEPGQVESHLGLMPRMWFLTQDLQALIHQSQLMVEPPGPQELRLEAVPLDQPEHWEVTVVAQDKPGLFSKVSGTFALNGLNILSAQIFTRQDRVALEIFGVAGPGGKFEKLKQDIVKALRGKISLDLRLAQKRSDYAGRVSRGKQETPQVRIDNGSSDFYTVIEVHAPDRVGLLYAITRALTELELDIYLAKVATYAEDVVDVFYVRDLEGQKVTEPEHIREIERLILHRLARD
jgi:[protein-PII] uridylyltransferase